MPYRYLHTDNSNILTINNGIDNNEYCFASGFDYHDQPNLNFNSKYLDKEEQIEDCLDVLNYVFRVFNSSYYFLNFNLEYFKPIDLDSNMPIVRSPHLGLRLDELNDIEKNIRWYKGSSFTSSYEPKLKRPTYDDTSIVFDKEKAKALFHKDILRYGLYMSQHSEIFESILLFQQEKPTYTSLCAILDSIKTHLSNNGVKYKIFYKDCGYSESDIEELTKTSNNYGLSGVLGRHGVKSSNTNEGSTISIEDAKIMIDKLASEIFKRYDLLYVIK